MKSWYKQYAKKVEATKSEESFSMTLRQVWRFLRDCHVQSSDSTLAQFDRIYNQGKRNHFTLLGASDVNKFDFIYGQSNVESSKPVRLNDEFADSSSEEDEQEVNTKELHAKLGIDPDDIHADQK